jgi:hypothetical protein
MPWQAWAFLLLPCASALVVGATVRRWRGALLAAASGLGLFLVGASLPGYPLRPLLPLATGIAGAGLVLLALLAAHPGATRALRIALPVGLVLAAHLSFLRYAMATR